MCRFDAELHRAKEDLRDDVYKREKLQREKDEVVGESYRLQQELDILKYDHQVALEKLRQLQMEMEEFERAAGNKDDKEVRKYLGRYLVLYIIFLLI